ncbi:MAG TPA: alkaline phosphatase family protein [Gaiellaceae bacterium]|nr:alkaline phosphatase family protein [Gaiellaceae bacterium]
MSLRTIAIGLDGCSWNVLEPLLATGELPHLSALCAEGAHGVLESTVPFFTGPAWASFATGASPAAHGIYDFMMLRPEGRLSVARQSDLRRLTYYQQLGREGRRSVLVNLPIDQDGCDGAVIVNSWLTDGDARRILPIGKRERYRYLLEAYRTFPRQTGDVEELCAIEQARFDLARELFLGEEWDHFFVLFSSTDWLGHAMTGKFLRGDEGAAAAMLRLYKQLDRHIGWLREHAPDALMVVLSDHGQCEERAVVRVNSALQRAGLIEEMSGGDAAPSPFFVDRRSARQSQIKLPAFVGRTRAMRGLRPMALAAKRALASQGVNVTAASPRVDRLASAAFSPTDASFAVYLGANEHGTASLERARDALLDLRLDDGTAAIEHVWTPEELYGRPCEGELQPALLFSPVIGVRPSAALKRPLVHHVFGGRGCHQRDGIVILHGGPVAPTELAPSSICDVAPTLLWAMEAGMPVNGDGRILFEAFQLAYAAVQPVREVEEAFVPPTMSDEDTTEVNRRLKALGYI